MKIAKRIIATVGIINGLVIILFAFFYIVDFRAILSNTTQTDGSLMVEWYFESLWLSVPLMITTILAIRWSKVSMWCMLKAFEILEKIPIPKVLK